MLGFGEDAGRFRAYVAEGHLLKVPMGDACLVMEIPRYLPWTGAVLAVAAAGGWAAWRWLGGRSESAEIPDLAGRASAGARGRSGGSLTSRRTKEGASPRVSRRARGASTSRSASVRTRRR